MRAAGCSMAVPMAPALPALFSQSAATVPEACVRERRQACVA